MAESGAFGNTAEECVSRVFRALSSPVRLKILSLIAGSGKYCGDLVDALGLAQSTVSHHLKVLVDAGLITGVSEGPATCYSVNRERCNQLCVVVSALLRGESADCGCQSLSEQTSQSDSGQV